MSIRCLFAAMAAGVAAAPLMLSGSATGSESVRLAAPVIHGNVAVYLLKGPSQPGPVPLTLAEGLQSRAVEVHETGDVRELRVENKGDERVFIQMGDIVKGGQQDRVLTVSLLLEPKSGLVPIGAYCVEQGRWSARGKEDVRRFAASDALLPSREAKVAIAKPSHRTSEPEAAPPADGRRRTPIEMELDGCRRSQARADTAQRADGERLIGRVTGRGAGDGQSEVWRNVGELQRLLSDRLSTSVASESSRTSLQLSLEHEALKAAQTAYVDALEPAGFLHDDVVGVAIAVGGRIASGDLYPSNGLFRKMWPKIVRAAATEGLAFKEKTADTPTVEAVAAFLADAEKGTRSERKIGALVTIVTHDATETLSVTAATPKAAFVHRSYLTK